MPRRFVSLTRVTSLTLMLALLAAPALARTTLWASGKPKHVLVGKPGAAKPYLLAGAKEVVIPVEGPGEISGFAKVHFSPGETATKAAVLRLAGVPGLPARLDFAFDAPTRGSYGDKRKGLPSGGQRISLTIPAGSHELRVSGEAAGADGVMLLFYYDGPAQVGIAPPTPKQPRKPGNYFGFDWRVNGNLGFEYNDNAFGYSDAFAGEYFSGFPLSSQEKYKEVDRIDDVVISPAVTLEGRRKMIAWGQTRIGLRYSREQYVYNDILANEEYRVYVRQATGKGKSLELYYSYSPSKYLRQLNDRPPLESNNFPVTSQQFRLTRNKIVSTWRQTLTKKVSLRVTGTQQLYYYNKPHLENDINSWELKGTLSWKALKKHRFDLTYGYRDATGRAIDVEGQDPLTSPASDGTYRQNHYQVDYKWSPPKLRGKTIFSGVGLRWQYQLASFPAEGTTKIEDDTYHVGREDNFYTYQISASRKVWYGVGASFAFRYAERDTQSPWWGDIKEDKNWIVRTYSVGLSYRLY